MYTAPPYKRTGDIWVSSVHHFFVARPTEFSFLESFFYKKCRPSFLYEQGCNMGIGKRNCGLVSM